MNYRFVIYKATLKKPWRSPRGRLYPTGSTFKLVKRHPESSHSVYDFNAPGIGYGWVIFPDKIFKQLTEEEKHLRALRRKMVADHLEKTKDRFIGS